MKSKLVLVLLVLSGFVSARADGVVDFVIDKDTGKIIDAPGSYRLAADMEMTGDVIAINVQARDVTIDLNGHVIRGVSGSTNPGLNVLSLEHRS